MAEKFSLKDELFNPQKVKQIAMEIHAVYPKFEQEMFETQTVEAFENLELKERITHIREMLAKYLPSDYREASTILLHALPKELDPSQTDDDFGEFVYAAYADFVRVFGCTQEHLAFSLQSLREITKRFSVEFAIRDFINCFPEETFEMLEACSLSENYHERRLASEGTRPKLPWGKKLCTEHTKALKILHRLHADDTRFVTRSVANHLNDIAEIDPPLVISTLQAWQDEKKQSPKEMGFMLNHALRTLIREGNLDALALLGYAENPAIRVDAFSLSSEVQVGESLAFSFEIEAQEEVALMIDYRIGFQSKSGQVRPKVYKLKKLVLQKGEKVLIAKEHLFKANMSTRKLYEGKHQLMLQINGRAYEQKDFTLKL